MMSPADELVHAAAQRGTSLAALSRLVGRNAAYLQQFVRRGSPRILPERERAILADFLGIDEARLGAPPREQGVAIPRLDVQVAAGAGRLATGERALRPMLIAAAALRALGMRAADASIVAVAGDSMAPALLDGDEVLVDRADRVGERGQVYVVRVDDALAIKRLVRDGDAWELRSDNPAYPPRRVATGDLQVIGRARLLLRSL